ncbi:MAG: hypothetical protein BWY11_00545 [Firmicutes bacterium ADurb.Bin182]|nr:MAG: hypothetical protein BWY11_00545 [Firmicutes bacterium ADurb.Bin182]
MSRKIARQVSMKLIFAQLCGGEDTYEAILEKSGINEQPTDADIEFSRDVLSGIAKNLQKIDTEISDAAIGWRIDRMPKVDLSILRIAVYEMLYCEDISFSVSINEAVELAKEFGGEHSPAFINGLLGTVAKKLSRNE